MSNYTYRIVVKPWYPSYAVERASLDSIDFDNVKWEVVSNGMSTRDNVKRHVLEEVEKMFEKPTPIKPIKKEK